MAAAPVRQRPGPGGPRAQLPPCYYEGHLEKRGPKEKASRRLWTCLCGNSLYFFNSAKDTHYVEKLDLNGFVSLKDDCSRDRNLEAARLILRMKDGETKLTAPNLESRELWKGFLYSVVDLNVPSCLTLLPGQLQMLRIRTPTRAPPSPLSVPLVGEIPPCFRPVSRTEAEVLLTRNCWCVGVRNNSRTLPPPAIFLVEITVNRFLFSMRMAFSVPFVPLPACPELGTSTFPPPLFLCFCFLSPINLCVQPCYLFLFMSSAYVSANDENGERILHTAPTSPLPKAPALPPKQDRWSSSSPLYRSPAPDRRILTSPVPASPTNPMRRLILSPSPLTQTLNEELKMKLEKRQASQE
uniref:Signal transducing adaptor family member 2a n=1 Tax=Scophthalmus maximus TaxID=52904 RepID=A0A8D2ZPZ2_SCOMX